MQPELTIQIVGWNSAEHLKLSVAALAEIPAQSVIVRYIDNASTDTSVAIVRAALPQADIVELAENKGFAGAHNIGFSKCTTPFVLTHDPDVVLNWTGITELLAAFTDEKVAAVQGKLLRSQEPNAIDSAGIVATLTLNGKERGAGEADTNAYQQEEKLLAVTGACGMFRLSALRKIAGSGGEVFDADFFAYKEDVDVGWRLNNAGFSVQYLPVIAGTHARTLGKRGSLPWFINPTEAPRRLTSPRTRYSIRNYIWMIAKNASPLQLILHAPFIITRLLYIFLLTVLVPPLFSVWPETLRFLPKMLQKRVAV
jgi:GT2 family glycosyltransferase